MRGWTGRVKAFAPVMIMVHDFSGSPLSVFLHSSQRPAMVMGLPSARLK